ncbi:MAG: competence/damage-inducible protein A [Actinomycetota bacterium]
MNCEVVAIGTELLLGQIVDTNSSYIGEQLAMVGINSHHQTKVGDNHGRMVAVLRQALDRSDAVICCGGLGPTQDDITRAAIAEVMGVELVRDEAIVERIRSMFGSRGRSMPDNNLLQADVPVGASVNPAMPGTAPGLICPLTGEYDGKVIYAVPGVPWEMKQMLAEGILPDLQRRAGFTGVIRSRTLRTWGQSESGLAEQLDTEIQRLDETGEATIAFLASGWEGLKVRITAKADTDDEVAAILATEERIVRSIVGDEIVFGTDDDTMESVVLQLLRDRGQTLAVAESLTGGLLGARLTGVPGSSDVFRGGVTPYDRALKLSLLGCPDVPAVSEEMARAMAERVCVVLGADVGIAVTGVAGPEPLEGNDPGDVWVGLHVDGETHAQFLKMPGDRERVRQFTNIQSLNLLRNRLLASG